MRNIVLDRKHSKKLISLAEDKHSNSSHEENDSLFSLVLFDEAEITFDKTENRTSAIERLQSEALITKVPREIYSKPSKLVSEFTSNITPISSSIDIDGERSKTAAAQLKSLKSYWPLIKANEDKLHNTSFEQVEDILKKWTTIAGGDNLFHELNYGYFSDPSEADISTGLPSQSEYETLEQVVDMHREHPLFMPLFEKGEILEQFDNLNNIAPAVLSKYVEIWGLTNYAAKKGKAILTNFDSAQDMITPSNIDISLGEKALQLCWIHLREVRCLPCIESLDDILRLREDVHFKNFQNSVFEWLSRISEGETGVEKKYREHIKLANSELEKFSKCKKLASPFIFGTTLAATIADTIFGTPFSFGCSLASSLAFSYEAELKKANSFALFRPN